MDGIVLDFFHASSQHRMSCNRGKNQKVELMRRDEKFGKQMLGSAARPELGNKSYTFEVRFVQILCCFQY